MKLLIGQYIAIVRTLEASLGRCEYPSAEERQQVLDVLRSPIVSIELDTDVELTVRQREILQRISGEQGISRIGLEMFLSDSTVKREIGRILKALGVKSRIQAVLAGKAAGVI